MSKAKPRPKSKSNIPSELKAHQDRSLTSKHIDALMKLDDTVLENEKLKSKVDLLEKELSSCLDLHEYAREAKKLFKMSQCEFEEKTNVLVMKHSLETETNEQRFRELLTENDIQGQDKISGLNKQVLSLQGTISELKIEKDQLTKELNAHVKIEDDMEETSLVIKTSKTVMQQLSDQVSKYTEEISNLLTTNTTLTSKVNKLESEVIVFSTELQKEKDKNIRLANKNILLEEIEKITFEMNSLKLEKDQHSMEYEDLQKNNLKLTDSLKSLQKDFGILKLERDVLHQSLTDLNIENELLKEKHQGVSSTLTFSNFIDKNQQCNIVKDEKPKLRPLIQRADKKSMSGLKKHGTRK